MNAWEEFLAALKAAGGSTDMQTSKTGRYPFLFHFERGQAQTLTDVVIYPGKGLKSPPRDWSTMEKILADYKALADNGGRFNDTTEVIAKIGSVAQ